MVDSFSLWLISSAIAMVLLLLVVDHDTVVVVADHGSSMVFKVGGAEGWHQPFENETADVYIQWASSNRFHVGDSLRFEYYKNDSVVVVDKYCFYHCNSSSSCTPSSSAVDDVFYQDGNATLIRLDKPGPAYFISGNTTHCKQGQRLVVQVMMSTYNSPGASPSTSIAIPPADSSYSTTTAAAPSSTTSFAPPPMASLPAIITAVVAAAAAAAAYL